VVRRIDTEKWLLCPVCANKTRVKVRVDTVLENFPPVLPKVQTRNSSECRTTEYINYPRARR